MVVLWTVSWILSACVPATAPTAVPSTTPFSIAALAPTNTAMPTPTPISTLPPEQIGGLLAGVFCLPLGYKSTEIALNYEHHNSHKDQPDFIRIWLVGAPFYQILKNPHL